MKKWYQNDIKKILSTYKLHKNPTQNHLYLVINHINLHKTNENPLSTHKKPHNSTQKCGHFTHFPDNISDHFPITFNITRRSHKDQTFSYLFHTYWIHISDTIDCLFTAYNRLYLYLTLSYLVHLSSPHTL